MRMRLFIIILTVFSISCGKWKVSSLKPSDYMEIKNGKEPGNVLINYDEFALSELSFGIGIHRDNVLLVDNNLKRIQLLDSEGKPELVIGSVKDIEQKDIKTAPFNFSSIGVFTMSGDGNIYVQNRFTQRSNIPGGQDSMNFSPSYILVFDENGKLHSTLGQRGNPDLPFYYIEEMKVDDRDRLIVVSRSFDAWSVFRFAKKKRDYYKNLSSIEFKEKDGDDVYEGKIENVKPYQNGETLMISVAYYHKNRLKFRRIYDFSIQGDRLERSVIDIPDPRNVLFSIIDDRLIYFWNMDSTDVKFMVSNMDGTILNNLSLDFKDKSCLYSKIISNEEGELFSFHVTKKGINIRKWD